MAAESFLSLGKDRPVVFSSDSTPTHTARLLLDGSCIHRQAVQEFSHSGVMANDTIPFRPLFDLKTAQEASSDDLPFLVYALACFYKINSP